MSILERILDANTTLIGFDSENEINVNFLISLIECYDIGDKTNYLIET